MPSLSEPQPRSFTKTPVFTRRRQKRSAMTCAFASVSNTVSERTLLLSLPVSHVPD